MNPGIILCWSPLSIVAVSALLIRGPVSAAAAETVADGEVRAQPAQVQAQSGEPQGHQMRRYQAFARQAELPLMVVINETTLRLGEAMKVETGRVAELTPAEKGALAGLFGVPAGVIAKVTQQVSQKPSPGAEQLARELRVAVVDYRFLQGEWNRYHPPAEGQQAKADALVALGAGDLAQAWTLYDGLSRPEAPMAAPAPPTNLRVVAGP